MNNKITFERNLQLMVAAEKMPDFMACAVYNPGGQVL
jgi:hypothetical protein